MSEIAFYHLERSPLEAALPKLVAKILAGGLRAVVKASSPERVESLNAALWTSDRESFLPHGSARDGSAPDQPVWLTADDENPNQATVLVLTDGAASDSLGDYDRCLEMFDGLDDDALSRARAHWQDYKLAGHDLTYWRQTDAGGWEKQDL